MLCLSLGLGTAAPVLFAATVAPAHYATQSCDAFSVVHLAGILAGAALLALHAAATPSLGRARRCRG